VTVCIAAICESGERIVVAADRMFTAPFPLNVEFETDEHKIEELADNCVALAAGNSAFATEVLARVRRPPGGNASAPIAELAESVHREYLALRGRKLNETIVLSGFGQDFLDFRAKGGTLPAYLQVQPNVYQQIITASMQYNLGVEFIIAGIDDTLAHILVVSHPGTTDSLDKLGYGAIGSGSIHALTRLHLGGQTRRTGFIETLYCVFDAKRASEAAPGVGRLTDIVVVERGKPLWHCPASLMTQLEALHNEQSKTLTPSHDRIRRAYDDATQQP
jgi:hypothetical protein